MELLEIMRKRRSVRKYEDQPIEKEKLDLVLQAGLLSASGRSIRPWEFIVVQDREVLMKMAKSRAAGAKMLEGAGAAIVVVGDENKADTWIEDSCIAMANMHLMADAIGLGSCWIQGRMRDAADGRKTEVYIQELLGIPENYRLEAMLSLGVISEHPSPYELDSLLTDKIHMEKF